ncbi:MAG: dihydrofolate reductase [Gammaproteobacteria bacterium]
MRISLIVAMTPDRVIGRGGGLPWHLPADLKRFKALTMGKPIIMGRRTFESLGGILPGRRHIVISRNLDYKLSGADVVTSFDAALAAAAGAEEAFVIGGAEIFRRALPRADRMYLTLIDAQIEGDTFFPEYDESDWREVAREERAADETNTCDLTFLMLDRNQLSTDGESYANKKWMP